MDEEEQESEVRVGMIETQIGEIQLNFISNDFEFSVFLTRRESERMMQSLGRILYDQK